MRDLTGFAVGIGIGLGCGAAVYMLIRNKQGKHTIKGQMPVNSERRLTVTQAQDGISTRHDQIEAIERQFFLGIDRKLTLTEEQIYQLKTLLKGLSDKNKDQFENCQTLQDILMSMKAVHLITPGGYGCITVILTASGIDASPITWHIENLSNSIKDITNGFEPRGFKADPFDYDAVIIHCEGDRAMVIDFINNSTDTLNIPDISLCSFEDFNIALPILQSIVNVLARARYVFVFVTPEFTQHTFVRFMTDMALTDSLQVEEKNCRIIPIWATGSIVSIPELEQFHGLKYWEFFDEYYKEYFLKTYRDLIRKGRNEVKQATDTVVYRRVQ